ncbi:MAG TPA: kelch repeat-containing protein [Terriglobales bacterium]|nr:kelch repeat-containing protein [Terriglobales bacterium]
MLKLANAVLVLAFVSVLCAGTAHAQWQYLGTPPTKPVDPNCSTFVFPCYTPVNSTPRFMAWMRAAYDPLDKQILIYANNPYCCVDASNSLFLLNTANAVAKGTVNLSDGSVWTLKWSNNDHNQAQGAPIAITSISRTNNVVTVNVASPGTRVRPGEYVVIWNVSDPSFNGTFLVASTPNAPPETQFTYNQVGPNAGPILNIGTAGGPTDGPHQPTDREPYHQMTWDTTRNFLWQFGGDAYGASYPGSKKPYCSDCEAEDLYAFDFTQPQVVATQFCGNFTGKCGAPHVEEGALVYDPTTDTIVWFGGLVWGTQVNDTYEYHIATNTWTHTCTATACIGGGLPPAVRNREGLVFDPVAGVVVMFGGKGRYGVTLNDTWAYSTTTHRWTKLASVNNPVGAQFPVIDWDPDRQSVVYIAPNSPAQVWELTSVSVNSGTAIWSNLNVATGPTLSSLWANNYGAYDQNAHRFVIFIYPYAQVWDVQLP